MVAPKADQMKKKGVNKPGNGRKGKMNTKNRVNMRAGLGAMFNPNQMLDNPGYMDFNEPIGVGHHMNLRPQQPLPAPPMRNNKAGARGPANNLNKKNRPTNNRRQNLQRGQNQLPGWGPLPIPNMAPILPPMINNRGPPGPFRGPMPPPPRMMGPPMGRPPLPSGIIPPPINSRFGPRPPIPPPLMGRPPLGMPRPPLGLGGPIPPRQNLPRGGAPGNSPIRRNKTNRRNNKKGKAKKATGTTGNVAQAPAKKVPLNKQNQYELDKPWVTEEIKAEHKKKEDLQNKLKGHKDDKLFEEFKVQREKFVKLYDAAKVEYESKNTEKADKAKKV